MLISRTQPSLRTIISSAARSGSNTTPQISLLDAFAALNVCSGRQPLRPAGVRYATHKAQGAVNKAKDGPGKRLGAKRSGEQKVIPGNIIFRQRGTHWFPGDNCGMGRDHTIYAKEEGYVKYYKDPAKHPKRQYIGVVFERDMVLPQPKHTMRRRRLGMIATSTASLHTNAAPIEATNDEPTLEANATTQAPVFVGRDAQPTIKVSNTVIPSAGKLREERKGEEGRQLTLGRGYMYRESNWEIGRAAERAKIKVPEYNRLKTWKKRQAAKLRNVGVGKLQINSAPAKKKKSRA